MPKPWAIWADTGGTFTDCVAVDASGAVRRAKVLSSGRLRARVVSRPTTRSIEIARDWQATPEVLASLTLRLPGTDEQWAIAGSQGDLVEVDGDLPELEPDAIIELVSAAPAPVLAARLATGLIDLDHAAFRLGTTKGTNALLERRLPPTAFFVTGGFGDLLRIGDQRRPDLFALDIKRPAPLCGDVVEVAERIDAGGGIVQAIDEDRVRAAARGLVDRGVRTAAIALAHSWINNEHERRVAEILMEAGFDCVAMSHETAPSIGLLARAETAVVSAALRPVVGAYLEAVRAELGSGSTLHVMTSAGGLASASDFDPTDGLLSGPAGGVIGAAAAAKRAGAERLISFDMGGTSTDVARVDLSIGPAIEHRHGVGDASVLAPALAIRTVAAGGGSICRYHLDRLEVGPGSAGADPGPASYGAGGPLTITDVNLLLGRLDAERFGVPLDINAAKTALDGVLDEMAARLDERPEADAVLEGFLELANERMAGAMSLVSAARGYDPAEHVIVSFGGAGGQHACGVARRLGVTRVLVPPDASLLSAVGIGAASLSRIEQEAVMSPLADVDVDALISRLERTAATKLEADGADPGRLIARRQLELRPEGQEFGVDVDVGPDLRGAFNEAYARLFGCAPPNRPLELVSARVQVSADDGAALDVERVETSGEIRTTSCVFGARRIDAPVLDRGMVATGVDGPALIIDRRTSIVVEPGWRARSLPCGSLELQCVDASSPETPAIIADELTMVRIGDIASQMGETIRRTSVSPNVKERLDYSCAVLDAEGRVVASAPHVPVHLGAMGLCVRRVREAISFEDGDVVITNHPAFGGSHLPDVTTITPVFVDGRLCAFVATRAHHAEIGGARPGSMHPFASSLAEEGAAIAPTHIVRRGRLDDAELRSLFTNAPHPSRRPDDNVADVRASIAANEQGRHALAALIAERGLDAAERAMRRRIERSARLVAEALKRRQVRGVAEQRLDDGSLIRAAVEHRDGRLVIDLRGGAGVHPGAFNAPLAVTRSAVMYVVRLLVDEDVPLNDGLLDCVDVLTEPGLLDPPFADDPRACPAVAAGNVETSQRLVDALILALGLGACSQGTMNNLAFGDDQFGFYETICGGAGAGPTSDGADAVHTHMTNTAITDMEIVERRAPVRVRAFAIRTGSGGSGRRRGGNGAVRELEFLSDAHVTIVSQHRVEAPYGIDGGMPGAVGEQTLMHADGRVEHLPGVVSIDVHNGDRLRICTPGGGGSGSI